MTVKQIIREGYEKKGRSTSGQFFGLQLTKKPFPKAQARIGKVARKVKVIPTEWGVRRDTAEEREASRQRRLTKLGHRAELQQSRATLEEQKARTRIAKRAGRVGRRRSYRGLSRKIGMRLI